MRTFIDTNILVYSVATNDRRFVAAREVLSAGGTISVQVLNEFANVLSRKVRWDWPRIGEQIEQFKIIFDDIVPLTFEMHASALRIAERYKIAFYDALLIAAAIAGKCDTLLTEDMQHGAVIEGITIRNPFL